MKPTLKRSISSTERGEEAPLGSASAVATSGTPTGPVPLVGPGTHSLHGRVYYDMLRVLIGVTAAAFIAVIPTISFAQNSGPFNPVSVGPSGSSQAAGLTPATGINAASAVVLTAPGNVYGFYATNRTSTAGFMILYNATAAPAPGALTANLILGCTPLPASGIASVNYLPGPPAKASVGAVILLSSAANCGTFTSGTITGDIFGAGL